VKRLLLRWSTPARIAVVLTLCVLTFNEFIFARLVSSDGVLDPRTLWSIRLGQAALALAAVSLALKRPVIIAFVIAAASAVNLSVFSKQVETTITDWTISEGPLRELRQLLPPDCRVGYISDEAPWTSNAATKRYYLTQYALAPLVVELGPAQEWVVGAFRTFDPGSVPPDLTVVRDFGGGLVLFRRLH